MAARSARQIDRAFDSLPPLAGVFANPTMSDEAFAPAPRPGRGLNKMSTRLPLAASVLAALITAFPACAQDPVAQFYRGKQLNLYIGSTPGGGYDAYARLLARKFSTYIPG